MWKGRAMTEKIISFEFNDMPAVKNRTMQKHEYKEIARFCRVLARYYCKHINWENLKKHFVNTCIYGESIIRYDELLKI